ncbi:hypothetical protein M407DRAFT_34640 [Tulasnella calospora MUT 4182]|uniref:Uncharacterized protein n=1 Tax=Tulasnella calospora MUT 4182 TaxID=1051891 RepID=A0A0C3K2X0_9AGAM|nr:hypothetical protein M407DRAFT_34640 [Tulasnella calospora MUT 4182]
MLKLVQVDPHLPNPPWRSSRLSHGVLARCFASSLRITVKGAPKKWNLLRVLDPDGVEEELDCNFAIGVRIFLEVAT